MTTRAGNIQFLLSGLINSTTGNPVSGGTIYFYESGTTTPKYVWTEIAKTNGYYSYALDEAGAATLFGEGTYRIVIKDSAGASVGDPIDGIRIEHPYYGIRTVLATASQVSQDDFILVNTTAGAVTINAIAAASWTRPLKVQRIAGANAITLEPNGAETVDGSANVTWNSDSIVEFISDGSNLRSAGYRSSFADADNDTTIDLERTADVDKAHIKTGGTDRVIIDSTGLDVVSGNILVGSVAAGANTGAALIDRTSTQTLTNKTLTSPKINEDVALTAKSTDLNQFTGAVLSLLGNTNFKIDSVDTTDRHYLVIKPSSGDGAAIYIYGTNDSVAPGQIRLYGYSGAAEVLAAQINTDGSVDITNGDLTSVQGGEDLGTNVFYLHRVGKQVTMQWATFAVTSGNTHVSTTAIIPAAYRPYAQLTQMHANDGAIIQRVSIGTDGTFAFYNVDYAGTAANNTSVWAGSVSWLTN